jgi:hypothetical protein
MSALHDTLKQKLAEARLARRGEGSSASQA